MDRKAVRALTKRQREILDYISRYLSTNGYPPTIREIREGFGLRSNRGVIDHLRALERKGHIRRDPRSSRAIELLVHDGEVTDAVAGDGGREPYRSPGHERVLAYPVAGRIEAGSPAPPIEDVEDSILIDSELFGEQGDFLLEVEGDSMVEDHIIPGDLLVVKRTAICENGDIVVAMVDGETTVKRFYRSGSRVVLHPSNAAYAPIVLGGSDSRTCTIIGKVIGMVRRGVTSERPFSG